jgi:hypothetical protein
MVLKRLEKEKEMGRTVTIFFLAVFIATASLAQADLLGYRTFISTLRRSDGPYTAGHIMIAVRDPITFMNTTPFLFSITEAQISNQTYSVNAGEAFSFASATLTNNINDVIHFQVNRPGETIGSGIGMQDNQYSGSVSLFGNDYIGYSINEFRLVINSFVTTPVYWNPAFQRNETRWDIDARFEIYGQVANTDPVPEPATILLFGTGFAGLAGTRLRKKKQQ